MLCSMLQSSFGQWYEGFNATLCFLLIILSYGVKQAGKEANANG